MAPTPYTYSIVSGALPAGLTLNSSTGAVTGTPTTAQTSGFTAKVVDSLGNIATSTCAGTCATGTGVTDVLSFNSPTGNFGNSKVYTTGGISITAYGYSGSSTTAPGTATALYGQNNSGSQNDGLGIASVSAADSLSHFVQLDISQAIAAGATNLQLMISGLNQCQNGESYDVFGSNTLGTLGTQLITAGTKDLTLFSIPNVANYKYIGVRAHSGNVLIAELSFTVPTTCSITVVSAIKVQCSSSSASVGQPYNSTIQVSGGAGPYTFSLYWGMLPAGLTLNTSTGAITGTPTTSQTGAFTIKVVDNDKGVGYSGTSGSCSNGTTISYGQNGSQQNSDGDRGYSTSYTSNNLPLNIYGYNNSGSQAHLWANNSWNNPGIGIS